MRLFAFALAALVAGTAVPAWALRPGFQVGAGLNYPAGAANGPLTMGGMLTIGGSLDFSKRLGVTLDYTYAGNAIDNHALRNTNLVGLHAMHVGSVGARVYFVDTGSFLAHAIVAPGLYYRRVSIDEVVGTAVGTYCDPWLLYCAPSAVPITDAVGSRDQVDFGLSAGLGIAGGLGPVKPYLEIRIERIWGDTVKDASGNERSTSSTFVPIIIGLRY